MHTPLPLALSNTEGDCNKLHCVWWWCVCGGGRLSRGRHAWLLDACACVCVCVWWCGGGHSLAVQRQRGHKRPPPL